MPCIYRKYTLEVLIGFCPCHNKSRLKLMVGNIIKNKIQTKTFRMVPFSSSV